MSPNTCLPQPDNVGTPTGARAQSVSRARPRRVSMSAQGALRWRATESLRPDDERICYDPVAGRLMGPFWSCLTRNGFIKRRFIRQLDREETGMANWIVGRTRYIDDLVKAEVEQGIRQLVILGAGYDTRAYRLHELEEQVKVIELDHLATLKFKVAKVKIALKSFPKNLAYVPIDFSVDSLEAKLVPKIYDRNLRTLFIWEGVTMYLRAEAVDQTLAFIAGNSGKGSSVVFDYYFESVVDGTADSMEVKKLRQTAARLREPLLFGIREDSIGEFLSSRGFDLVQNLSGKSVEDAYFKGKGQQRKVFPLIAIVSARVRHQ
jgi:methyltransferase (TIGR00027 family)